MITILIIEIVGWINIKNYFNHKTQIIPFVFKSLKIIEKMLYLHIYLIDRFQREVKKIHDAEIEWISFAFKTF